MRPIPRHQVACVLIGTCWVAVASCTACTPPFRQCADIEPDLDAEPDPEVLPNLFYLRNGTTFDLGGITVGGVGGCYGPSNYERLTDAEKPKALAQNMLALPGAVGLNDVGPPARPL